MLVHFLSAYHLLHKPVGNVPLPTHPRFAWVGGGGPRFLFNYGLLTCLIYSHIISTCRSRVFLVLSLPLRSQWQTLSP